MHKTITRAAIIFFALLLPIAARADDFVRVLQSTAIREGRSPLGHWGPERDNYTAWRTHTNRLIPVYTFGTRGAGNGIEVAGYIGANSAYRSAAALKRIYGRLPTNTLNPA